MATASDHPAPSEEVERKPAKYMEAESVARVKHEEPACPAPTSTESEAERVEKKVEPLPVNERVEGDIKPKAEGSVDVATSLAEDVDNKALQLPSAEEKKKAQVAEHKPVELSISEPSTLKDATEEAKEKTGEEIIEVKEKVSDPGKIEATSEEKRGATQEFVQFEENPTNVANTAEDEVTDKDIKLIADNAKTEAHTRDSSYEPEKDVAADTIKETLRATEAKMEATVGAITAEFEGEKQVDETVNDAKNSEPLTELIAENTKIEADNKESSDELQINVAAESINETVKATDEKIEGAIKAELDGEEQIDEPVHDAKRLPEPISENSKTEVDNKEASEETDKNVAAEKIKESVQATEEKIEESVRTIKAEVEGEKQVEDPVNDAKCSNPLPELIEENAKTEADNKESGDDPEKNVVAESIKETDEKIEETVGTIEGGVEGEKKVEEPVNDAKSSDSLHELISENAKTEKDNKESSDEPEKNVAAESIKESDEKIEETVGAIKAELDGEKHVDEPVHDAKTSDPLPELIAKNAKTEADSKESSDEPEKNVAAESIKETDEKIEETVEAIKAELDGEKQVDEPVHDAKSSDPCPELIAENAITEANSKESSDELEKNVAADSIKETDEKIEENVGAIKTELDGEKQVHEPVHDAKTSDPLPELIAEHAKTEADNKESSDEPEKKVATESIKETDEEIVGTIKAEVEGQKQVEEPVNDAKCSDYLPEFIAENAKTEADNKETSDELGKNVAVESIKDTSEKIEETVGAIKAELDGEKQVHEPIHDAKTSDPLPELIEEHAKTEGDNKESSDEPEKKVAAESIKETDEKIEEIVGTIKAEVEGQKQVEEPVNDAKCSDYLPEFIAENAKTEADNKESSDELGKNVTAESIKETSEKIEETVGAIKADLDGEKRADEPVNDAKTSDPLPEPTVQNAKTEADYKEANEETDKNVAAEKIKESVQATEEKFEESVRTIKGGVEGMKQVEEPVIDAKCSNPLPELIEENAKTEADNKESSDETEKNVMAESIKETDEKVEETVGTIEAEVEGGKQVEEPVNDGKSSDSLHVLISENAKTEKDNKEPSDEPEKNVARESIKETDEKIEETVEAIKAELDGEKQVDEPVYDAKISDSLPEFILQNDKTAADNKEASEENDKNVAAEIIKESVQATEEKIEETAKAIKPELEGEKQVDELVKNPECIKEIEDPKKPQDVPVKTHKQSIVKMVKQSLVKAKKAITGKSHNSKTQASEPKDEGN